ncbi:MAG: hypothetical protein ACSHX9_12820 [Luteolibacter sp.]
MSKDPKPSGSKPSEIVPKLAKTQQEATEHDLWDLDEDTLDSEAADPVTTPLPAKKVSKSAILSKKPVERQIEIPLLSEAQDSPDEDTETPAPLKKKTKPKKVAPIKAAPKKEEKHDLGDINDLDDHGETDDLKVSDEHDKSEKTTEPKAPEPKPDLVEDNPEPKEQVEADSSEDKQSDSQKENSAEGNETPKPFSLSSFSKVEKFSLLALIAVLSIAGILSIVHFSNRVPTKSTITEEIDFPVDGSRVTITSAETYWREPKRGDNADVVRRGTKLIPVIDISLETKKSAAIRIFFRNDEGQVIGDGITRDVSGKKKLKIPATAGFDDIGMHAAYRTGGSPPWFIQVYEGPNANASREQFKKVLDTEISTDRR